MAIQFDQSMMNSLLNNNATMTVNGSPVSVNQWLDDGDILTITADSGYKFYSNSVYFFGQDQNTGDPLYLYFSLSEGDTVATTQFIDDGFFVLEVDTIVNVPDWVINSTVINSLIENEAVLTVNSVEAVEGTGVYEGDLLEITLPEGREFYIEDFSGDTFTSVYFFTQDQSSGEFDYISFNLSTDLRTATLTYLSNYGIDFHISTNIVTNVRGSNNAYLITKDDLDEVNKQRFQVENNINYDYGQFILSVLELPFTIPPELILIPSNIQLGQYTTDILTDTLDVDLIPYNLGSISVPANENSSLDFINTTCILHLPRIEPFIVENEYVIGQTIQVEYLIDIYTGIATVNIISSKIDGVILSKQVNLGVNIPYAVSSSSDTLYNSNIEVGGENGVIIPYIEVLKNEAVLVDGFFTIPVVDEDLLENHKGFIKVEEIELKTNATSNEKDGIINALSNGVIIND